MKFPRIMITAPSSGSGKTLITCGILQALVNRGIKTASFKCGPDYIDPMFHSKIIGTPSKNLDRFFTDENTTRYLFAKTAADFELSVIEGVMGYYDGISVTSLEASSYALAKTLEAPVILVVNCKGMSGSVIPMIKGFLEYQKDSNIKGVILNQMPKVLFSDIKGKIEETLGIKVIGYLETQKELVIESRHLGLVTPDEIGSLNKKLNLLAEKLEETLDLDLLISLAEDTGPVEYTPSQIKKIQGTPRIAVAKDEAFCFYYEDNLELMREMGAEIVYFSPIRDHKLPVEIDGLLLGGGYPELYASQLSANPIKEEIKKAVVSGLPCVAECGGFMYLHRTMEDINSISYEMAGVIDGKAFRTHRLNRFGYITLSADRNQMIAGIGEKVKGHEFHYFDSDNNGDAFLAEKPLRNKSWNCIHGAQTLAAGFPHLYYYSNTNIAYSFLEQAIQYRKDR